MHLATLPTKVQLTFYLAQGLKQTPHIRVETDFTKPVIPTQQFRIYRFWYIAQMRRETPAEPYVRQPYLSAKPRFSRRLPRLQTVLHAAMNRVAPQLSIETCAPQLSVETPASAICND